MQYIHPINIMKTRFWELAPSKPDRYYIPDAQEIAEMEAWEELQEKCKHENFNNEDGCLDCGYYAK